MPAPERSVFRPTIAIFVGPAGERMLAHYQRLLAGLDPPLRRGVVILATDADGQNARRIPLLSTDPAPTLAELASTDTLDRLLGGAIEEIQHETCVGAIKSAGYRVPDSRAQIYIIGEAGPEQAPNVALVTIAQTIQETLRSPAGFSTLVGYLLSDFRQLRAEKGPSISLAPPWAAALVSGGIPAGAAGTASGAAQLPLVSLAMLFQEQSEDYLFRRQDGVEYGMAAVLFGLTASGLSVSEPFAEPTQVHAYIQQYHERVGSMGTSLLRFPRAEVERYATYQLAADCIRDWGERVHRASGQNQEAIRREQAKSAGEFHDILMRWLKGPLWRYAAPPLRPPDGWPSPRTMQGATIGRDGQRQEGTHQLIEHFHRESGELIQRISEAAIEQSLTRGTSWAQAARARDRDAELHLGTWDQSARRAWEAVRLEVERRLRREINELWLASDGGLIGAYERMEALSKLLPSVQNTLATWRRAHEDAYQQTMRRLRRIANDDRWRQAPGPANRQGSGPFGSRPSAEGTPLADDLGGSTPLDLGLPPIGLGGLGGAGEPGEGQGSGQAGPATIPQSPTTRRTTRVPNRDRATIASLGRRVTYYENHLPTTLNLALVIVMALPALTLLAQGLMTPAMAATLPATGVLTALVLLGLVSVSKLYHLWAGNLVRRAQRDQVAALHAVYTHICNQREDQLRAAQAQRIQWEILALREQLNQSGRTIFANLERAFRQEAEHVESTLFAGPSGANDVLIANGEWLQGSLAPLYSGLLTKLHQAPLAGWHATTRQINERLLAHLRTLGEVGFVLLGDESARETVGGFIRREVLGLEGDASRSYLPIGDPQVARALTRSTEQTHEIWRELLRRATPRFRVDVPEVELTFVAGRAADLWALDRAVDLPSGIIRLLTLNPEWLVVAIFWLGGMRDRRPAGPVVDPGGEGPEWVRTDEPGGSRPW